MYRTYTRLEGMKKEKMIRANFKIEKDAWELFRLLTGKFQAYDEKKGKLRPATASDVLREFINEYFTEHTKEIDEILQEMRRLNVDSSLRAMLEEEEKWKKEEK